MSWATWPSVSFALTHCVMGVKGGMASPVVEVYGAMLYDTVDIQMQPFRFSVNSISEQT